MTTGGARFSPDGKKIVYKTDFLNGKRMGVGSDLFVYNIETKESTRITNNIDHVERYPCWSPDGKQILFVEEIPGRGKTLQVINADGSNKRQVIGPGYDITDIDWTK